MTENFASYQMNMFHNEVFCVHALIKNILNCLGKVPHYFHEFHAIREDENKRSVSVWGRRGQTPSPWRSKQILELIVGKEHIHRE